MGDPSGNRHPPGLKYMFTELFCNAAGGPEVVTSKGYDEAKLGIDPTQWPTFLALVEEAARMWPTKHHRDLVMKICESSKEEICAGLEGQATPVVRGLGIAAESDALNGTTDFAMPAMGACPFSENVGGQCPVSGRGCPFMGNAGGKRPVGGINSTAPPTAAEAHAASDAAEPHHMAGRVLGSTLQQKLDELTDEDPDLCCPVSLMVFNDPVKASDGFMYEKASLMQLLANRQSSPMTRESLQKQFQPATEKLAEVQEFRKTRSQALIKFAREAAQFEPAMAGTALDRVGDYLEYTSAKVARAIASEAAPLFSQLGRPMPASSLPCLTREP